MKIVIPGELADLNQIIEAAKQHHQRYNELKRENTEAVAWLAKRLPKMERINLIIHWYCKNKRKDKDNVAMGLKFILDGLVEAGVIKNDGWKQIGDFSHKFYVDKNQPRIEIEITEVV